MAQVVETGNTPIRAQEILGPIQQKVEEGKRDRARFEGVVHSNRAFAAGKHWLKMSRSDRRLMLDSRDIEGGKERVTIDLLSQYLNLGLSQLRGAEERPQLLFRREDLPSEDFTKVANDGLQYGWDSEWEAARQLDRTKRRLIVDGTAAIQCVFDPTVGKPLGDVPLGDGYGVPIPQPEGEPLMVPTQAGRPLLEPALARAFVAHRQELGETVRFKSLNEGRICWKPRSFFNLIVPPAIEDEEEFPWLAIISAASIESLKLRYGAAADPLIEEPLAALELIGLKDSAPFGLGSEEEDAGTPGKLTGHVALVQWFGMPDTKHKKGRVVTYARNTLLEQRDELPYRRPNGDYCAGVAFFHYWRVEGRFWGRGLIEPGKGIQRTYNKRCQQEQLTIDRGQPYMVAEENQQVSKKTGTPLELVRYRGGTAPPAPQQGIGPGPWIWESKRGLKEDLEAAMGLHGLSLGEEPSRETTYAEIARRIEQDAKKIDPIVDRFNVAKNRLVEFSVWDMRRYWPADKHVALEGESGEAEAVAFNAQKLPEFFLLSIAEGSAKPRDQAAQIQLVFDLFQRALDMQQPLPLSWLYDSIQAGRPLPLPEIPTDVHAEKAEWENSKMWDGELVEPKPYDPPEVHVPIHREGQVQAEMAGRPDIVDLIEQHVQMTEFQAEQQALREQQAQIEGSQAVPLPQPPAPPPEPQQTSTSQSQ